MRASIIYNPLDARPMGIAFAADSPEESKMLRLFRDAPSIDFGITTDSEVHSCYMIPDFTE